MTVLVYVFSMCLWDFGFKTDFTVLGMSNYWFIFSIIIIFYFTRLQLYHREHVYVLSICVYETLDAYESQDYWTVKLRFYFLSSFFSRLQFYYHKHVDAGSLIPALKQDPPMPKVMQHIIFPGINRCKSVI